MNTQRLIEFQDRTVRDLAWAILSPPLIQFQSGPVRGATADWCLGQFEDFAGHLKELDRDPRPLLEFLGDPTRHKLGKYFENLIAYWLEASPNFELLARNLQIRDEKKTYGELDLIVHDRKTGRTGHWEVAAKFYLQLGSADDLRSWVGPNRRDNLGRKSQHLLENQARRAGHPVAHALLAQQNIPIDEAFVFLKGHLFKSPTSEPETCKGPIRIHPECEQHTWVSVGDFARTHAGSDLTWQELTKPNWLADQSNLKEGFGMRPWAPDLCDGPNLVIGLRGGREIQRSFVVPDGWDRLDEARC